MKTLLFSLKKPLKLLIAASAIFPCIASALEYVYSNETVKQAIESQIELQGIAEVLVYPSELQRGVLQAPVTEAESLSVINRYLNDGFQVQRAASTLLPKLGAIELAVNATDLQRLINSGTVLRIEYNAPLVGSMDGALPLMGVTNELRSRYEYPRQAGAGATIAIVDSGIDASHSWFQKESFSQWADEYANQVNNIGVVDGVCISRNLPALGVSSFCPGATELTEGVAASSDCSIAGCGHGTAVASAAAGAYGVAPFASLVSVKVGGRHDSADDCAYINQTSPCVYSSTGLVADGLLWLYEKYVTHKDDLQVNDLKAVNISQGSLQPDCSFHSLAYQIAIDNFYRAGIPVIVASGNDGLRSASNTSMPACYNATIAVGGIDDNKSPYVNGNLGDYVDFVAPAVGLSMANAGTLSGTKERSGTSFSAPMVAGLTATINRMLGINHVTENASGNTPSNLMRVERVKSILSSTGEILDFSGSVESGVKTDYILPDVQAAIDSIAKSVVVNTDSAEYQATEKKPVSIEVASTIVDVGYGYTNPTLGGNYIYYTDDLDCDYMYRGTQFDGSCYELPVVVDWGDGTIEEYVDFKIVKDLQHTYESPGVYRVVVVSDYASNDVLGEVYAEKYFARKATDALVTVSPTAASLVLY